MNTLIWDKRLIQLNYSQKTDFLIDCIGYTKDEFEGLGEIWIDNIIIDGNYINECIWYNK